MANANYLQSSIPFVAEAVPGTTPSSPSLTFFRTTNPLGIQPSKSLFESDEVLSHRQEQDTRHGVEQVTGSLPFHLSWGAYRPWLEALFGSSFQNGVLKPGTDVKTFTVEQRLAANRFYRFTGVTPTQLSLTIDTANMISGQFDVLGMGFNSAETSLGSATYPELEAPYDGLARAVITEGGSEIGIATSINLTISANTAIGGLLGSDQSDAPAYGVLQVSGTMTARLHDLSLFEKFKNETESSLEVRLNTLKGNGFTKFIVPRLKYVSGQSQNNNNVIDGSFDFRGLYDQASEASMIVEEGEDS